MDLKKFLGKAIMAASVLALAGTAQAGTKEINLYGASAQFLYWHDVSDSFMTDVAGCTGTPGQAKDAGGKTFGLTVGQNCTNAEMGLDDDTLIIRYSSKASFDGIRAITKVDPAGQCPQPGQRLMADETTANFTSKIVTGEKCLDVTLGASDVGNQTFVQESHGLLKGPAGGAQTDRSFNGIPVTLNNVNIYRPLVVPFGFFANTSLTGVTDITRTQALLLFSGTVSNWDQFGPGYPTADVVICLRHAGSGTHATLDAAVMRGDWNLVTEAKTGSFPKYYFNDTSGDMMNCINGQANSIGYADADQTNLASTKSLTYNGRAATAQNIQYGLYEFWSTQWIFEKKLSQDTNYNVTHPIVAKLMEYAAIEDNIPSTKEGWWTTSTEMKVEKANDFAYLSFK